MSSQQYYESKLGPKPEYKSGAPSDCQFTPNLEPAWYPNFYSNYDLMYHPATTPCSPCECNYPCEYAYYLQNIPVKGIPNGYGYGYGLPYHYNWKTCNCCQKCAPREGGKYCDKCYEGCRDTNMKPCSVPAPLADQTSPNVHYKKPPDFGTGGLSPENIREVASGPKAVETFQPAHTEEMKHLLPVHEKDIKPIHVAKMDENIYLDIYGGPGPVIMMLFVGLTLAILLVVILFLIRSNR